MPSQPSLLDTTGSSLPGPQFVPRPGWGGQLQRWFTRNAYAAVFRMVIVVAVVLIARSLFTHLNSAVSLAPSTSPAATLQPISVQARAGDGMTNLAARALDMYAALQTPAISLDGAQHLYAVDALTRTVCWCPVEVNQEVAFASADIKSVIDRALALSPAQRAAWNRLLK